MHSARAREREREIHKHACTARARERERERERETYISTHAYIRTQTHMRGCTNTHKYKHTRRHQTHMMAPQVSSTKKVVRFHTPLVIELLEELCLAREELALEAHRTWIKYLGVCVCVCVCVGVGGCAWVGVCFTF